MRDRNSWIGLLIALLAVSCTQGRSSHVSAAKERSASSKPATTAPLSDAERDARAAMNPLYPTPHPVPLLSPEEEAKTFHLPPGLHAEVVAAEPMIIHPVAMKFDADGRLWVVEMRSYMPDIYGHGENKPIGRISVLQDTNGDGRMDKCTVFLDHLVMPRAVGLVRDGVLVGVPPKLLFCRDTNGDGVCDEQTVVETDYGDGVNPEHQANGLLYNIDNWIYNTDYHKRIRYEAGHWISQDVPDRGQWGITQDDTGRMFYDSNSDYLRGNLIPPIYATRNPDYQPAGVNVQIASDEDCWPSHDSAENRGYREGFLRPNGRLRAFTAACSPCIYRGDLLPHEYYGNAFVCEATANLVRRSILTESDAIITGKNAYDQNEFIASTYERFRPANLYNGPDGALYVVDIHHGLIQHRLSVTPYVHAQYFARELNKYLDTGRIFRIVPDGAARRPAPKLSTAMSAELVAYLSHANGWDRDTAQRLLVEHNSSYALKPLKTLLASGKNPLGRLHALWTLEGMNRLDLTTIRLALHDADWRVRAAAIRVSEPILGSRKRDQLLADVMALESDAQPNVRLQYVLTISAVGIAKTDDSIARVLHSDAHNLYIRDAALSGMRARELQFLTHICTEPAWASPAIGRAELFASLARCVMTEASPKRVLALLDLTGKNDQPQWRQTALLQGIALVGKRTFNHHTLLIASEPQLLVEMMPDKRVKAALAYIAWPGKPGYVAPPPPRPLTADEQARFAAGRVVFMKTCIQCHKIDGKGQEGLAPPLMNSDWVLGSENRIARIALHGLRGPITVEGETYNLDMPSWAALSDEQLASVLTYIRRSWLNEADPIAPQLIARLRKQYAGRVEAWSERELLTIK